MSPEQAIGRIGRHPVDHRTDIYSLGVVLFELLTGALPLSGTRSQILHDLVHGEPPGPRSRNPRVSPDLDSICLKAMAREPRLRYASARELADDLRNFLQGEPVRARPISRWQRFLRRAQRRPAETALGLMGARDRCWRSSAWGPAIAISGSSNARSGRPSGTAGRGRPEGAGRELPLLPPDGPCRTRMVGQ